MFICLPIPIMYIGMGASKGVGINARSRRVVLGAEPPRLSLQHARLEIEVPIFSSLQSIKQRT